MTACANRSLYCEEYGKCKQSVVSCRCVRDRKRKSRCIASQSYTCTKAHDVHHTHYSLCSDCVSTSGFLVLFPRAGLYITYMASAGAVAIESPARRELGSLSGPECPAEALRKADSLQARGSLSLHGASSGDGGAPRHKRARRCSFSF